MMHKKNFVTAIKVGGKVLRESSERVELPFGSEYSVLLKNLDTVRMQAQIGIDGQDATGWLVIEPGKSVEVERFYRGNKDQGNRFKFIERTERIEEHRGIKVEDGLVRVEFKREKVYELPKIVEHHTYYRTYGWPYFSRPYYWTQNGYPYSGPLTANNSGSSSLISNTGVLGASVPSSRRTRSSGPGGQSVQASSMNMQHTSYSSSLAGADCSIGARDEVGITVDGSVSQQRFISVAGFETESPEAIVLHLVGRKGTTAIPVAKTVDCRPLCEICGMKNKVASKFCVECGTSLERV